MLNTEVWLQTADVGQYFCKKNQSKMKAVHASGDSYINQYLLKWQNSD